MSLAAGTSLGPYEIITPLGAGGMGEVYRARDARLGRDVALKVLPEAFASDPDRLARFRREAQVLASLNHPNIGHIYGFEETGAFHALVLELVDGPTLADRIVPGPLALADALPIAKQIAEALEAAHEQGVVHRDLKPANVKVRADGTVKVLDFGLAKGLGTDPVSVAADAMNSPTVTNQATSIGVILGTAAYMAPEQARGQPVDKRADTWAFGCVLYEMITGYRPFDGTSVSDVLAAVLRAGIEWQRLPAETPPSVRRLLARCLERDPKLRLRDIGEARIVLADPAASSAEEATHAPAPGIRRWAPWAAAALLMITSGVGWWGWSHVPLAPLRSVTRSAMILPGGTRLFGDPALSRDGTQLVYSASSGGKPHLMLRMMDELEGKPIPGADDGFLPVFSPDGKWIAYYGGHSPVQLKKIPVTGGPSITLFDVPGTGAVGTLSWGDDDTIVLGSVKGLIRVPAAGGPPEPLTALNTTNGETDHTFAQLLPGAHAMLFTVSRSQKVSIAMLDLQTRQYHVLVNDGSSGRYVPPGYLVYKRGDALFAVPFDLKRLAVAGSETPVVEGVEPLSDYTVSETGLLVFRAEASSPEVKSTLEWMDRKGGAKPLPEPPHDWGTLALSPDGRFLAGAIWSRPGTDEGDIWKYDLQRTTLTRLTFGGSNDSPVWTPDGRWVTFVARHFEGDAIYRVVADASGPPQLLVTAEARLSYPTWTPDGQALLYVSADRIWTLPAPSSAGASKPRRLFRTEFRETRPQVSPDGKWLAYESDESGRLEVYVVPFPGPGPKLQISTLGAAPDGRCSWSRNGRELFYDDARGTGTLMAVDMQTVPPGRPQPLFTLAGPEWWQDVTSDSLHFLVLRKPETSSPAPTTLVVITNWFEDLQRRAPIKK